LAIFTPFFLAFLLNLLLIPLVRRASFRLGRVAQPRPDRWHLQPTPTLGGVGIFAAFAASLLLGGWIGLGWLAPGGETSGPAAWIWRNWGFLSGSVLLFALGLYDEFRPISPAGKLAGQIIAATLVILLGYTSTFFSPKIANSLIAQLPNILLTYLWLVGITNAINLLDNMDGLAGGIGFITSAVLSYFFWRSGTLSLLWVSLALAGSLLGFLVYNFPPAKIFMGDSGSLFLGFTLATLAIANQKQQASDVFAVLGVPTLLFLLPILDTALVTFTRLLRGQSPVRGDRDHTSHRLVAFGLSERQTLFVLYAVALASAALAAALESLNYWLSLALVPLLILSFALLAAYLGGLKVVNTPAPSRPGQTIARLMADLTYRRRLLEVILDFALISLAYYLAFLARYSGSGDRGLVMNEARLELYLQSLPLALACGYLAFFIFGVYRGVWRYIDLGDLLRYVQSALGAAALLAAALFVLGSTDLAPWAAKISALLLALFAVFLFLGLAATRSSFRLLDRLSKNRARTAAQPVLILGAGDAGEMAARWIQMNPQLNYRPVGFLDDDPLIAGRQIHGVDVLGGLEQLEKVLQETAVSGVILAGLDLPASEWQSLVQTCQAHGCWVRALNLGFELVI
jgi:UDP-GlcNAc:undecaprenyl-phosphate GlcNAc-1-phosphate transferase